VFAAPSLIANVHELHALEFAELNSFKALLHLAPPDEAVQVVAFNRPDTLQLMWRLHAVTGVRAITIAAALQPRTIARGAAL
jgi:hypothetical protein